MARVFEHQAGVRHFRRLIEVATRHLYRQNAFRVLGLSVNATPRDIRRRQAELSMRKRLGIPPTKDDAAYFPLDPPPTEDDMRKAEQRLNDAETRLVDELFWFWPSQLGSDEDDGLELLAQNRPNEALSLWLDFEKHSSVGRTSTHNLAVLYHLAALELEHKATEQALTPKETKTCAIYWQRAYRRWRQLLDDVAFWENLTGRIRHSNNKRLKPEPETARRIWATLPRAILTINARIAISNAEIGQNLQAARRHVSLMRESGVDHGIIEKVLRSCLGSVHQRIRMICEPVEREASETPDDAAELARGVLDDCKPLMRTIDLVLQGSDPLRRGSHDEVAKAVRDCTLAYGNNTQDWKTCIELLAPALEMATGEPLRDLIKGDLGTLDEIAEEKRESAELKQAVTGNMVHDVSVYGERISVPSGCTCCLQPAESQQKVSHSWEETRRGTRYKRERSFNFPLCKDCEQHQNESASRQIALVATATGASVLLSYLICFSAGKVGYIGFVLLGLLLSAVAFFGLSYLIRVRPLGEDHASRGPAVSMESVSTELLPGASLRSFVASADGLPEVNQKSPYVDRTSFRFWNPLYAHAFAKANNAEVTTTTSWQYSRGRNLLRGLSAAHVIGWVTAIVLVANSIIYAIAFHEGGGKTTPSSPARRRYAPRPDRSRRRLKAAIDGAKAELRSTESDLETLERRIQSYKATIEDYESRAKSGLSVDRSDYRDAIDTHNALIGRYKSLLSTHKGKVEEVNDMVRRYNAGAKY